MDHALACQDLARTGFRAQARRQIERSPPIATLDGDRLTGVQAHADAQRQFWAPGNLIHKDELELGRRT